MQDEILVRRLQEGDRAAFDELYTRYRDEALRTASLITGSRADGEDVVQEAFVQCYQRIGQLRDPARFKAWLFKLMTRAAWKYCRRRGREEPVAEFFEDSKGAGESALGTVLRTEQSRELFAAVQRLDEHQRAVVVLYYFNDMAVRDIARVLGCREGTVKSRLFAARHCLLAKGHETPCGRMGGCTRMKDFELDTQLRKTLHDSVDDMRADDLLKERIDFMVKGTKSKKTVWKKITVGVAAALCLTTMGAFARGQLSGLASSIDRNDMLSSASDLQKQTGEIAEGIQVPEALGGLDFQSGIVSSVDKLDEEGTRFDSYPEMSANYGAGGTLTLTARAFDNELDNMEGGQSYEGQPKESREIGGVTVAYQADRYIFLPPDAQPTAEEAALEAKGELYISYGSSEREEQTFQHVSWQADGVVYSLLTSDDSITAEDLFTAAADAIGA